jgi:hypothetical protein
MRLPKSEGKNAMRLMMIFAALMLVTSCESLGPATNRATICAGWAAIHLDPASIDGMTERDAQDILAHNEFGLVQGCW